MTSSFRVNAIRGVTWTSLARLGEKAIGYVRIAVLARLLGPAEFGVFGIVLLIISMIETLSETGIAETLIQKKDISKKYIQTAWVIFLTRGLIQCLIVVAIARYLTSFFNLDSIQILYSAAGILLLHNLVNPSIFLWRKQLQFNKDVFYQLSSSLVEAIVAISAALYWSSYWALIIGFIARALFQIIMSLVMAPLYKPSFDTTVARNIFNFGKWINANSILSFATHEGDDIVVGKLLGSHQLGLYQNAYKFSLVPVTSNIFSHIAYPLISIQKTNQDKLEKTFKLGWAVAYVSFLVGGIIWLFPNRVTLLLLGAGWLEMAPVLQLLIIYGVLRSIGSILGQYFPAIGQPQVNTKINIVKLLLVFIPLFSAIQYAGIRGAALVVVFASVVANLLQLAALSKHQGFGVISKYKGPLIAFLITVTATTLVRNFFIDSWPTFILLAVFFIIFFVIVAVCIDKFLQDLFTQMILPLLPKTWRNKVIKVSLWIKRGHWHDFNWRQKAQLASSKEWQQKYDLQWQFDRHDSLLQTDIDWILSQLAAASNKTVLEIGPGTGKLSHRLNQAGYQVTTVDISQTVLQNLAVVGVTKIQARAEKLPFKDKSFDVIVATHLLEHVANLDETIKEWKRVGKDKLIIIVPQEEKPDIASNYHLQFFPSVDALTSSIRLKHYQATSHTNPLDNKKYIRYVSTIG